MLFNSYFFLFVFLPLVLAIWWSGRLSERTRLIMIVAASYFFYGWWDYRFVALLAFSSLVDYMAGRQLHASTRDSQRLAWLIVSLATNLGLLGFFKYSGFLAGSVNDLLEWARYGGRLPVPEIILPVGISFYTFQTLSYTIDIYRRKAEPANSFWHFAAYVSLFPQLIAGPIVRYTDLEDQLRRIAPSICWDQFAKGLVFFVVGLGQKILLADLIASRSEPLLADYASLQMVGSWYAMLGYTCQLYFDFAGYSNMAVGLGLMLGFAFPQNFDSPYKSQNISEFWRRWHITLSSWLRDYLFVPLGGSRHGRWLTLRNLFLVMFLGGLWHGAGWTFVLWGVYHGLLLVVHSLSKDRWPLPRYAAVPLTFVAVVFGWVLFRSTDMTMCEHLIQSLVGLHGVEANWLVACGGGKAFVLLAGLLGIVFFCPNLWEWRMRWNPWTASALAMVLVICVLRLDSESPFLYFQF